MKKIHEQWMREALRLAEKGRSYVSPNPMVGVCVVRKGRKLAEGYHRHYGADHAEVHALKKINFKAKGATLYVTLEPCSSWGKTPPCVAAIVRSGIRHVVVGALDPNPRNHRKGILALKKEGIRVTTGILARESEKKNESFFKYVRTGLPFVTLKMAQSLDGKIASKTGRSRWITSPRARTFVHHLRAEQDAILVGKNTLKLDNPFLSPRCNHAALRQGKPWRVVLDPALEVSPKARIFRGDQLTVLAVSKKAKKKRTALKSAILIPVNERKGRLDLNELLKRLAAMGVAKLLVEGGGELAWSLLESKKVDKLFWVVAPKIIGGRTAKTSVEGDGFVNPSASLECKNVQCQPLGEDWLFQGELKK